MGEKHRSMLYVLSCEIPWIIGMLLGSAWGGFYSPITKVPTKAKPREENLRTPVNGFISAKTL